MTGGQFLFLPQGEQPAHGRTAQRRQEGRRQASPHVDTGAGSAPSRPGRAGHSGPMSRAQARSSIRRSTTARLLP